jgi:hypothetical protein
MKSNFAAATKRALADDSASGSSSKRVRTATEQPGTPHFSSALIPVFLW